MIDGREGRGGPDPISRGLCPQTPGIQRLKAKAHGRKNRSHFVTGQKKGLLAEALEASASAPDRRSGRFPALPYPPSGLSEVKSKEVLAQLRVHAFFSVEKGGRPGPAPRPSCPPG